MSFAASRCDWKFTKTGRVAVCVALSILVISVYCRATQFGFLDFDDDVYVTRNPYVAAGLTPETALWSFQPADKSDTYWHPLTWLSHMLDVTAFGMSAGPHHFVNVLLHASNTCLLYLLLYRITGSVGVCALAAAIFAIHPIHVESVAWIAERKNVLSTFLWLLSIGAYLRYARHPHFANYLLVLFLFMLGLMSKPMLVTLPFVLLLLDLWPLGRIGVGRAAGRSSNHRVVPQTASGQHLAREVIAEKIPFILTSVLVSTLCAMSASGAESAVSFDAVPLTLRLQNALVGCLGYLAALFWPAGLAVFYPYPTEVPGWLTVGAGVAVLGFTVLGIRTAGKRPYLLVGWLWFLCTLLPVSGLIQRGLWPALADRWAYVPSIGILIILTGGLSELLRRRPLTWRACVPAAGWAIVLALSLVTLRQLETWRDTTSLFQNAVDAVPDNYVAHDLLGAALEKDGHLDQAEFHYLEAIRIRPDYYSPYENLGLLLQARSRFPAAEAYMAKAVMLRPTNPVLRYHYGNALMALGHTREAIEQFRAASEMDPFNKSVRNHLGLSLLKSGDVEGAIEQLKEAIRIDPGYVAGLNNLAVAYLQKEEAAEAAVYFRRAFSLRSGLAAQHDLTHSGSPH